MLTLIYKDMKNKLIILFLLLSFAGFGQNQLSVLQKGLIFHAPLSENYPTTDLISGTTGVSTDTYNVLGRGGEGRRWLQNTNTSYSSLADADRYDFGTGDFTLIASFTPDNVTDNGKYIISKEAGGIGYGLYQEDNDLYVRFDDNSVDVSGIIGTDILAAGVKITCEVVFSRAGNAVLYVNNSASSSGTLAISSASGTLNNTGDFVVGNIEAHNQGFSGQIHFVRAFNFALTTQIANYSKPEYPIEATHRGTGATKNVLDLNAEGMASATWVDRTNSLTATNSGTTLVIPPASNLNGTYFNGTTSKIVLNGVPTTALGSTDRTMSVWINPQSFSLSYILGYGQASGYGASNIGIDTNAKIYFNNWNNDAGKSITAIAANAWSNVVVIFSAGVVKYYINGAYDSTTSIASTNTSAGNLYIGVVNNGTQLFFNGRICNGNIWNRILSADEIKLIYDTNF